MEIKVNDKTIEVGSDSYDAEDMDAITLGTGQELIVISWKTGKEHPFSEIAQLDYQGQAEELKQAVREFGERNGINVIDK